MVTRPATIWRVFSRFFSLMVVTYKMFHCVSWTLMIWRVFFCLNSDEHRLEKNWVGSLKWINNEYSCKLASTKFTRLPIARKGTYRQSLSFLFVLIQYGDRPCFELYHVMYLNTWSFVFLFSSQLSLAEVLLKTVKIEGKFKQILDSDASAAFSGGK